MPAQAAAAAHEGPPAKPSDTNSINQRDTVIIVQPGKDICLGRAESKPPPPYAADVIVEMPK